MKSIKKIWYLFFPKKPDFSTWDEDILSPEPTTLESNLDKAAENFRKCGINAKEAEENLHDAIKPSQQVSKPRFSEKHIENLSEITDFLISERIQFNKFYAPMLKDALVLEFCDRDLKFTASLYFDGSLHYGINKTGQRDFLKSDYVNQIDTVCDALFDFMHPYSIDPCPICNSDMFKTAYRDSDGWSLMWRCSDCDHEKEIDWPFPENQSATAKDLRRLGFMVE